MSAPCKPMRFLGIGDFCDLGALYMRLIAEGNEVKVYISDPFAQGTMAGLVEHCENWKIELPWIKAAGDRGIILFENVAASRGELQDELRRRGFQVIGGSAYGDRLETDRAYAQEVLGQIGMKTCPLHAFCSVMEGIKHIKAHPQRYVLKFNGSNSAENYVGAMDSGADVRAILEAKASQGNQDTVSFILMDYVIGVEMGVGAYFNGEDFIGAPCLDWEHKRFFPGDLGEITGEMGTVATFDRSRDFFHRTLERMGPLLRQAGYCGYINLNTIVNEEGIWPLEFTCRFGYPGFAVLGPLQQTGWGDLFYAMVSKRGEVKMHPGFSVGIVLTTPPFPYDRKTTKEAVGMPVFFQPDLTPSEQENLYYGEVGLRSGQLVTSGQYGWTMVATGTGRTIDEAQKRACTLADKVIVANVRFRRDIGHRLLGGDYNRVESLGLFGADG